jgi:hypothetical protein
VFLETSPLVRVDEPAGAYKGLKGAVDWISDTVASPLINAALIDPYNTISHAVQDVSGKHLSLGEIKPLAQNKAEPYSTSWFVESAMGGLGSIVPFVIAGKATGGVMRGAGRALGVEGRAASILASDSVAQLAGAGLYAGMKRPQPGETRLGNAVSTVAGFAIFEAGNKLTGLSTFNKAGTLPLLARTGLRVGTGFAGGVVQSELSSLIGHGKPADRELAIQSGVGGAFLNSALGAAQDIAGGALSARQTQNHVASELACNQARVSTSETEITGLKTATGKTYGETWQDEFKQFQADRHVFRPQIDYGDARADSPAKAGDKSNVVYIVVDSGFSPESLPAKENIVGVWDPTGQGAFNDPLHHGSIVLSKLRDGDPDARFMLIRAFDGENNLAQTRFENGQISRPGWTEAYLEAVALADKMHLPSVANCSFGELTHAMDGTGWESFQLNQAIGDGKAGHAVVAASGAGNGAARHASGIVHPEGSVEVSVYQKGEAAYNFWTGKDAPRDWQLSVYQGDRQVYGVDGSQVGANFWNNRQQVTFKSQAEGDTRFVLSRSSNDARPLSFDCWVQEGKAAFLDHVNPELISEPAVFPNVVAVGIRDLSYSPFQNLAGHKPDVLVPGDGPVSFRTPEITLSVGKMLKENPQLDAPQIQKLLGKNPQG